MKKEDRNRLIDILVDEAQGFPNVLGPQAYFRNIVENSDLPPKWQKQRLTWSGVPAVDALELINWALSKRTNPKDPRFDTLGSILHVILDDLGAEDARTVAAIISAYRLYHDPQLLDSLAMRYQVPIPAPQEVGAQEVGPPFVWRGPVDDKELQSWLQPEPNFYDVGFLKRGIERAAGVCRIELPNGRRGTGFLVSEGLLLTNYHVFKLWPDDDLEANVRDATFRFGCITAEAGSEAEGQTVTAATDEPIVRFSPVEKLDYVLVRLDPMVQSIEGIKALPFNALTPSRETGLHILQHPDGKPMMVALSTNGVTGVYSDKGLFQYVTNAAGGSSGAPCFDDNWNVVGVHHAERSRVFGAIREGILIGPIYDEIRDYLSNRLEVPQ